MPKLDEYKIRAKKLIKLRANAGWSDLWRKIDDMVDLNWSPPGEMDEIDYVHVVKNTDPRDAVEHSARIYTGEVPRIAIDPWALNKPTKAVVGGIESWLRRQRNKLVDRNEEDLDKEVMRGAVNRDFLIGQLEYLPWQLKLSERRDKNSKKGKGDKKYRSEHTEILKESLRLGDFLLKLIDPGNAFPRFSVHGLEECLLRTVIDLDSFVAEWGPMAKKFVDAAAQKGSEDLKFLTVWDLTTRKGRAVWAYLQDDEKPQENPNAAGSLKVMNAYHKLPFLPIVAVRGGKKLNPMLKSIVDSGQWDTVCSLETAVMTEALAMSWAPRGVIKGPDGKNVKIVYGSPARPLILDDFHEYTPLPPPQLDANMLVLSDRERLKMEKSTLSSVLQGFSPSAGVAFAAINTATQSALKVLNPHRRLAERFWGKVFFQMVYWAHFADTKIDLGRDQGTYSGSKIPIERVNITVKLRADVPIDLQARMNTAAQAIQVGYSKARALELANESDPEAVIADARRENFEAVMVQGEMGKDAARLQLEAQLENQGLGKLASMANDPRMMQVLQQMQQQIEQEAAQGSPAKPAGRGTPAKPGQAGSGVGGPGFAGNAGGQNTAEAAPEATREMQNQEDRSGTPI